MLVGLRLACGVALAALLMNAAPALAQLRGADPDREPTAQAEGSETAQERGPRTAATPEAGQAQHHAAPAQGPQASEPAPGNSGSSEVTASGAAPVTGSDGVLYGQIGGQYQLRGNALSDIPLTALPWVPQGSDRLGQRFFAEQWLRLRGEVGLRDVVRLVGQMDLLWGIAAGEVASGVGPAAWPRDALGYPGVRLRQLYLEWRSPIGLFRVGQMSFGWGLGIVANDGETPPPFGDPRFGDLVRRVLFATRPLGEQSPFVVAVAGDWVAWDLIADHERRGDLAWQGLLAAYFEQGDDRLGGYLAYRAQQSALGDTLEVFVFDAYGRAHAPEPSGGRLFAAGELAVVGGATSATRTVERPRADVLQLLAAVQLGRLHPELDVVLETGYASGDSNPEDEVERRGTFDPDHRVGLVLFPEVIAAQTARAAYLAQAPELAGRPARGSELLPTNGGVAGAWYVFPYAIWRPAAFLDVRLGAVLAWAATDVVDPWRLRAHSQTANFRGGDPGRRDLGVEVDAAIRLHGRVAEQVEISGGLEGGVLVPGRALDDAEGRPTDPLGLARLRFGLHF